MRWSHLLVHTHTQPPGTAGYSFEYARGRQVADSWVGRAASASKVSYKLKVLASPQKLNASSCKSLGSPAL